MRTIDSIALDLLRRAVVQEHDVHLIGEVTAAEIVRVAAPQIMTCPSCGAEAWVNIDCDTCLVVTAIMSGEGDVMEHNERLGNVRRLREKLRARDAGWNEGRMVGERDGYRRALWHVAIGCEVTRWQSGCTEYSPADTWYLWLRNNAVRSLVFLGDDDAVRMVGGAE